jgi:hypothetical protein
MAVNDAWSSGVEEPPATVLLDDAQIRAIALPARIAAVLLLGGMHAGLVGQIALFAVRQSAEILVPEAMLTVAACALFACATQVYGAEHRWTVGGVGVGLASAVLGGVWFLVLLLVFGSLSLLAPLAAGTSALGGVACLVLLPSTSRLAATRRSLAGES